MKLNTSSLRGPGVCQQHKVTSTTTTQSTYVEKPKIEGDSISKRDAQKKLKKSNTKIEKMSRFQL